MASPHNHLIDLLPRRERQRLLSLCESVKLVSTEVLCEPGEPTRHVYFPTGGFISLVALMDGHPGLEVGMVGREGMLGAQLTLGLKVAPVRAFVQGAGEAIRVGIAPFCRELARSATLRRGMHRYVSVLMVQLATSSACSRFHLLGPRLARWLLMSQDRVSAGSFQVTHESLAYMLGVRRARVTLAASALHRRGLIEYHRGKLSVLDRSGLEAAACSCYASDRKAYRDLV